MAIVGNTWGMKVDWENKEIKTLKYSYGIGHSKRMLAQPVLLRVTRRVSRAFAVHICWKWDGRPIYISLETLNNLTLRENVPCPLRWELQGPEASYSWRTEAWLKKEANFGVVFIWLPEEFYTWIECRFIRSSPDFGQIRWSIRTRLVYVRNKPDLELSPITID